jgi:hypothetical protein
MVGWMVNNALERIWTDTVVTWSRLFGCRDSGNQWKSSVRISGVQAEIRIQGLLKRNLEALTVTRTLSASFILILSLHHILTRLILLLSCGLCFVRFGMFCHWSVQHCKTEIFSQWSRSFVYLMVSRSKGKKVKLSLCLTKHYAMKTWGGVDV